MPETSIRPFRVEDGNIIGDIAIQVSEQCQNCRHFALYSPSCGAFPDGIPRNILDGDFDHTKLHPDQGNDILFEQITEEG